MKPYYERDGIVLFNADCREVLPTLAPVDLVLTDPPYGIAYNPDGGSGVTARGSYERVIGDDSPFDPTMFLSFPNVVLWGANHYASKLPDSSGWLSWVKIGDGASYDCSDVELAWTSRQMPARRFSHIWRGMIRASERETRRVHPTQKPIVVMAWCLSFFPDCQSVLDPFNGSGTTGVACIQLGRTYTGIEASEKYCEISARRFDAELDKGRLFDAAELSQSKQLDLLQCN